MDFIRIVDSSGAALKLAVVGFPGVSNDLELSEQPVEIDQIDKRFFPEQIVVTAGQKIAFPNSDNIRHHVYSFSKPKIFEIALFKGKPGEPILFDKPGIVVLGCNIHDSMVGYIYVADSDAKETNELGLVRINPKEFGEDFDFTVWHSRFKEPEPVLHKFSELQRNPAGQWELVIEKDLLRPVLEETQSAGKFGGSKFLRN